MKFEITKEDFDLILMLINFYEYNCGDRKWKEVEALEKRLLELVPRLPE